MIPLRKFVSSKCALSALHRSVARPLENVVYFLCKALPLENTSFIHPKIDSSPLLVSRPVWTVIHIFLANQDKTNRTGRLHDRNF